MGEFNKDRIGQAGEIPLLMRRINAREDVWTTSSTVAEAQNIAVDADGNIHIEIVTAGSGDNIVVKVDSEGHAIIQYYITGNLIGYGGEGGYIYSFDSSGSKWYRYTTLGVAHDNISITVPAFSFIYHASSAADGFVYNIATPTGTTYTVRQYDGSDGSLTDSVTITVPSGAGAGITTSASGNVYVLIEGSGGGGVDQVKIYDSALTLSSTITLPATYGSGGDPYALATDDTDIAVIGVADSFIRIFNSSGTQLYTNGEGTGRGPHSAMCVNPSGELLSFANSGGQATLYRHDFDLVDLDSWLVYELHKIPSGQTRFHRYPTNALADKQPLAPPDGGAASPKTTDFNGRAARSTLTLTGNAANNETFVIDARTYTWKTTLTGAANEVLIGASASASIDNAIAAIMGTGVEGTNYGLGTVPHATAGAIAGAGDTMIVSAYNSGTSGDSIATTDTMANASWTASTLGGANPSVPYLQFKSNPISDMRAAIQALAPYYVNVATGNPFNWTASSADNLYFKAVGTYYDWQGSIAANARVNELNLNEIDSCLDLLETSDRI